MSSEHYWRSFYRTQTIVPSVPSQFAALVASDFSKHQQVIEFGSGNCRDAKFFSSLGKDVIAIDGHAEVHGSTAVLKQIRHLFGTDSLEELVDQIPGQFFSEPTIFYARFFLHSISEDSLAELLDLLDASLPKNPHHVACFEYRTTQDASAPKLTGEHFRRFIDSESLRKELQARGHRVDWHVDGYGLAKFKDEDPSIGRVFVSHESRIL